MESQNLRFLRISELAVLAHVHPDKISRLIYREVIKPDGILPYGKKMQPIFSESRVKELLTAIKQYDEYVAA